MANIFYPTGYEFKHPISRHSTYAFVEDSDTLGAARRHKARCCLNFASHKRPGGGYKSVMDVRGPIRTQEEDIFRRSNLPEIMDNVECRTYYPLRDLEAFYTVGIEITKDQYLRPCEPFPITLITVPAVVDPQPHQYQLVQDKIERILDIAAENNEEDLVLGAWGCGVFNNDPQVISDHFRRFLIGKFQGVFKRVIFAIPNKEHVNHQIFAEVFDTPLNSLVVE